MTFNILNAQFTVWTRVDAPTPELPFWHDAEDGSRYHLRDVTAGADAENTAVLEEAHAESIKTVLLASMAAGAAGNPADARRLAVAAARLCEQTIGLWPTRLAAA